MIVSAATEGVNEQARQCCGEIVESLQDYLKGSIFLKGRVFEWVAHHPDIGDPWRLALSHFTAVCKVYSEQKAMRVKRVIDRKRT